MFGYAEQIDGAIGLALGMSAVIWAIFNFRALVAGVCTTPKALDRFTFQLRRTIGTAICLEIVFGLYYSAWCARNGHFFCAARSKRRLAGTIKSVRHSMLRTLMA